MPVPLLNATDRVAWVLRERLRQGLLHLMPGEAVEVQVYAGEPLGEDMEQVERLVEHAAQVLILYSGTSTFETRTSSEDAAFEEVTFSVQMYDRSLRATSEARSGATAISEAVDACLSRSWFEDEYYPVPLNEDETVHIFRPPVAGEVRVLREDAPVFVLEQQVVVPVSRDVPDVPPLDPATILIPTNLASDSVLA